MKNFLASRRSEGTNEKTGGRLSSRLRVMGSLTALASIAIAAVLTVGYSNAKAQGPRSNNSTGNIQNGKRIFAGQNCTQCHGSQGQGGSAQVAGPRIGPPRLALPMFMSSVREPMKPMPPYSAKAISDAELADVYAYLSSLPPAPAAETAPPGNAENGKRVYIADGCYECHDREGQGGAGTGPRLAPNPIAFAAFTHQLRSPVNEMPPYTSKVLPDKELADIYAFLQAIPKPPSPDNTLLPQ